MAYLELDGVEGYREGYRKELRLNFNFEKHVMQLFECRLVRYWSSEINGTRIGGQKK